MGARTKQEPQVDAGTGDLIKRTAPAGGLSRDAQTRMLKNLTDELLGETAGEFKGLQDPKIRDLILLFNLELIILLAH